MIRSAIKHQIRSILPERYLLSRRERKLKRLKMAPRYTPLSTNLLGPSLKIADGLSFYFSFKEIFDDEIYFFHASTPTPYILDCGANIGLAVIYFKRLYPQSRIIAFEPEPNIFSVLHSNMQNFRLPDVTLVNKALWITTDRAEFMVEGADGSRLIRQAEHFGLGEKIQVETLCLRDYLRDDHVDFLKLDIEGAETDVLLDCADSLHHVEKFFIEYHSFVDEEQRLDELLYVIRRLKFRVRIYAHVPARKPLGDHQPYKGQDLQLNIFGYRL